jgi:acetate---CoA ligase (ADP-forming)
MTLMLSDARRRNLGRLLRPQKIAVVGGRFAEEVIRQSRKLGFAGRIYPINPKRAALAGIPCLARIRELPEAPDAAFLGIGREATIEAVAALAALGAGGAVCYASGFAEVDDGKELQRRLVEAAGDMAVVGPNCYGVLNLLDGVALWPDEHGACPVQRGVALITQSGNIGITLTMQERGLPIACVLSVGNQAQLAVHDYIDVLSDDPRITAIGLYLEAIPDPGEFARVALRCSAKRVPLVAIKAGRSEAGARAALSHTSSLVGQDALIDVFLRRYGVVRVESLADLLETLKLLHVHGPLPGRRVGSLSCSGGDAAMVADLAHPLGLELPPIPNSARAALAAALGERVTLGNPLDYHTYIWGDPERMACCFAAMLGAGYDATLLVLDYPRPRQNDVAAWDLAAEAMLAAAETTGARAIVASSLPETLPRRARERLVAAGIAPMQGLPECLRAVANAAWQGEVWQKLAKAPPPLPAAAPAEIATGRPVLLGESAAKALLAAHGLRVPAGVVVQADQAAAAAARLGFPVALKTAATLAHKGEAGGVVLNLESATDVALAAERMATLDAKVLVERMLPEPVAELIVGIKVDAQLGPHLLLGAGGTLVELWHDVALVLLPASAAEVLAALRSLRIMSALEGYRSGSAADLEAVVEAISRIALLAMAQRDRILELEINPLMVYQKGEGAIAADALIRLQAPCGTSAQSMEEGA